MVVPYFSQGRASTRNGIDMTSRLQRLCVAAIQELSLDLTGARVLTEAASGSFVVTPLLAALAGGQVDAVARDSKYGRAEDIIASIKELAVAWRMADRINFHTR